MAATLAEAKEKGIAPWDDPYCEIKNVVIFNDRYPVTTGHLLFVPKNNTSENILECFSKAQKYGDWLLLTDRADGYNIGINSGKAAGQTVMYPHVHLIPRKAGDCEDPTGGVRGVVSDQANYKKSSYTNPVTK